MTDLADIVFVNGTVLTMDSDAAQAEALAVTGSLITAVGDRSAIEAHIGPSTRVVDLDGGTLLPGINDSHIHVINLGVMSPPLAVDVGFPAVRSIAEAASAVHDAAATREPGAWIKGGGWDPGYLDECRLDPDRRPTRHDLDSLIPDHPVLLHDFSLHSAWVNSAALRAAGIDPDGDHSADDSIVTDAEGRPTGLLHESGVRRVQESVPPLTNADRRRAIMSAVRTLSQLGVTSITDPALGPADPHGPMSGEGLDVYRELLIDGELTVRVNALRLLSGLAPHLDEFERNLLAATDVPTPDPRRFNVVGTKIFADGIPPNRSAWMYDDYVGGGVGSLTVHGESDDERVAALERMIHLAHRAGHQIGVHATGDRGADAVITAMVKANDAHPRDDARHYVIHADFLTAEAIARCAANGIGANMNPSIKWTIADLAPEFVGKERADYEWPYRDAITGGVNVASASDAPVTQPDWRQGVSTMVLRTSKASGSVSGAEQTIDVMTALRTYTINAAWQDHAETWKGSLEVGKVADLCVIGANLLAVDPADIPAVPVTMTVLDGKVVHESTSGMGRVPVIIDGPVGGHYGPSTRLVPMPHSCGCEYGSFHR